MRGDSSNWLPIGTIGQLVAPAWFTPRTLQLYATGRPMKSVAEDDDQ
jgi:hypothetical protein